MINSHLFDRFPKPDVILGQHVMPPPAGQITYRAGVTQSEEDNIEVRLFGRGGHGAWPESTIHPVVMVGSLRAGAKGNVIPNEAVLKINVRSFDDGVRTRMLAAIKRIVTAEAAASGAPEPPSFTSFDHFDLTINEPAAAHHVGDAFRAYFGADRVTELTDPLPVSEDFGLFGQEWKVPSLFWYVGGTDPSVYQRAAEAGRIAP